MKKKTLKDAFKQYEDLMFALQRVISDYARSLSKLHKLPGFKDIIKEYAEMNEDDLKQDIVNFENQLIELMQDIANHIKDVCKLLKRENTALSEEDIESLNKYHRWGLQDYITSITQIEFKKDLFPDLWDYSKIDFSEIDNENEKLDSAIKEYNENNLKLVEYKLQGVYEIIEIVIEQRKEFLREQEKKMKKEQREFDAYYEKHKDDIF